MATNKLLKSTFCKPIADSKDVCSVLPKSQAESCPSNTQGPDSFPLPTNISPPGKEKSNVKALYQVVEYEKTFDTSILSLKCSHEAGAIIVCIPASQANTL